MRERTFEVERSAIAGAPAAAGSHHLPRFLAFLVAVTIGSSFYVNNEPAPTDLLFLVLLAFALFYRGFGFRFDVNPVLTISVFAFLFSNVISIWASLSNQVPNFTLSASIIYFSVTVYLFLLYYTISTLIRGYGLAMISLIKYSFIFAACVAALLGILISVGIISHATLGLQSSGMRVTGTFKDPNVYAAFLGSALAWLFISLVTSRKHFLLQLGLLCVVGLGVIGAFSRGAFVNVLVSIAAFFILRAIISLGTRWLKRFMVFFLVAVLLGAPLVGWYLHDSGLEEFFSDRLELQKYDSKRFSTQLDALLRLDEFPFGVGPGRASPVLGQGTHNIYVNVLFEYGLLGGISFYLFILTTVWIAFSGVLRRGPYSLLYASFLAILTGILVNSLVIDTLHWRHFFLFLALPMGLARFESAQAAVARQLRPPAGIAPPLARRSARHAAPTFDHRG